MRLFESGARLLLDCAPAGAERVTRSGFFRVRLREHSLGLTDQGEVELVMPGNAANFQSLVARLRSLAERLGCELAVDPALCRRFEAISELAEQRYRAGNELKRHDPKYEDKFQEFCGVLDEELVRPLKDRQFWDAFYLATMQRAANFSVPGSGKTATVLGAFAFLARRGIVRRVLVMCPRSAFASWRHEWEACFGAKRPLRSFSTQDPEYRLMSGSRRRAYLRSSVGADNLLLVNFESAPKVADLLSEIAADETLLVVDEAHKVKRPEGTFAGACLTVAQRATATFVLTGTPIPQSYLDLYNMLHIMYPQEYDAFFGYERGELADANFEERAEINERVQPFYCRTTKDDLGVPKARPDQIVRVRASDASSSVLGAMKRAKGANLGFALFRIMQLESDPAQLIHHLELSDCLPYLFEDEGDDPEGTEGWAPSGDDAAQDPASALSEGDLRVIRSMPRGEKREACCRLVSTLVSEGKPVIVWCILRHSMGSLKHDLAKLGIEAEVIMGGYPQQEREQVIEGFRRGDFKVLITTPLVLAESVSLHDVCHDAVYFEYTFALATMLQSKDRIHRLGLVEGQETNYYYLDQHFAIEGEDYSMDERVYEALRKKEQVMYDAIDAGIIETPPTTMEDLEAIFKGLF